MPPGLYFVVQKNLYITPTHGQRRHAHAESMILPETPRQSGEDKEEVMYEAESLKNMMQGEERLPICT